MNSLRPFVRCMADVGLLGGVQLNKCQQIIKHFCGHRFSQPGTRPDICLERLWNHDDVHLGESLDVETASFDHYQRCIDQLDPRVQKCLPIFRKSCKSRPIRAVKTVRATMHSVEALLEKYPNFLVIHSYRDPRPTVLSRHKADWSASVFATDGNLAKTAHAYCQTVVADSRKRKELQAKYPGRIKEIVYQDYISDPIAELGEIYQFLGIPISEAHEQTFMNKTMTGESRAIAEKWRTELSPWDIESIEHECQTFSAELEFNWNL